MEKRHTKACQYFVTLDLIPSNARQECVATALSICLFPDLRSSLLRSVREVRASTSLCWRYVCFSPTSEGSATSSQHDKTLVRRLPGLPDLLRQPCREKRMRKRNSTGVTGHGLPPDRSSGGASVLRTFSPPGAFVLGQKLPPQGESSPLSGALVLG